MKNMRQVLFDTMERRRDGERQRHYGRLFAESSKRIAELEAAMIADYDAALATHRYAKLPQE